jgi:hypothetical protein
MGAAMISWSRGLTSDASYKTRESAEEVAADWRAFYAGYGAHVAVTVKQENGGPWWYVEAVSTR